MIWGGNKPSLGDIVAGHDYNFWRTQLAKQVAAGAFSANPSWKGYADIVTITGWTSRPANSSKPPAGAGAYIGVIVSTSFEKQGPVESGNIR